MFAALISGKTAKQTEVFSGVKQQTPRSWGRAAASGSSHCERTMWQIGHSTGDFRLRRNRIAVAAQSQTSIAQGIHAQRLAELLNT
jgi:hypothetical protein